MKIAITEVRSMFRPTDATLGMDVEEREYPEGNMWQVLGEIQLDDGTKIGGFESLAAQKEDFGTGDVYVVTLVKE